MEGDTNFALIVIGIVAIVGIIGMLNLNEISGKATAGASTSEVIDKITGTTYYCSSNCAGKTCTTGTCINTRVKTGTPEAARIAEEIGCAITPDADGYYTYSFCG